MLKTYSSSCISNQKVLKVTHFNSQSFKWKMLILFRVTSNLISLLTDTMNAETTSSAWQQSIYTCAQVINGNLPMSPVLGVLCGQTLPGPLESSGNTMVVIFRTDGGGTGRGFRAVYTTDNMAGWYATVQGRWCWMYRLACFIYWFIAQYYRLPGRKFAVHNGGVNSLIAVPPHQPVVFDEGLCRR